MRFTSFISVNSLYSWLTAIETGDQRCPIGPYALEKVFTLLVWTNQLFNKQINRNEKRFHGGMYIHRVRKKGATLFFCHNFAKF